MPSRQRKPSPQLQPIAPKTLTQPARLLNYNEVPSWYSDNPFIVTGYRPLTNSTSKCLSSLFYLHNECLNIYTHLIPALAFLVLEISWKDLIAPLYPEISTTDSLVFGFFLLTAVLCLGLSASFHTMMNHSEETCHAFLQLDLIGIVILTLGDFVSGIYMVFYCERGLRNVYWGMISTLSLASLFVLLGPFFRGPRWRALRVGTFVSAGLSGFAPLVHGLMIFGFDGMMRVGTPYYLAEGGLLLLGAGVYMTRIPESLRPGRFDYFGSSHQIFHVLVVCATGLQVVGLWSGFGFNYGRTCEI